MKEPTCVYQNSSISQIFKFGGYVKVRESLYAWVIIWDSTALNHTDTSIILPRYEGSCMVYIPK